MSKSKLPPDPLPAIPDPLFPNGEGIYSKSGLREVCGTKINPDSIGWYKRKDLVTNPDCVTKTAVHPDLEAWLGDIQGYDPRSSAFQPPIEEYPLSAVIPQVQPRVRGDFHFELYKGTYLINAMNIQSNPMTFPEQIVGVKKNLPEGSQLYLGWFGPKSYVSALWPRTDFWELEYLDEFDGFLMPDFSAFSDDPIPQYMLGERMQQIFAQEGAMNDKIIIPTIAWASEASLRRQVELWTSCYPRINTISFDCYGSGVSRVGWLWRWIFAIEKYLQGHDHIRFIFAGINSGWAIKELNRIFPKKNYHLVSSNHEYIRATSGSADKEQHSRKFRQHILKLEDFRSGKVIADSVPRPDEWPTFTEIKRG